MDLIIKFADFSAFTDKNNEIEVGNNLDLRKLEEISGKLKMKATRSFRYLSTSKID